MLGASKGKTKVVLWPHDEKKRWNAKGTNLRKQKRGQLLSLGKQERGIKFGKLEMGQILGNRKI